MDSKRVFIAILISFIILLGYQYLVPPPVPESPGPVPAPLQPRSGPETAPGENEQGKPVLRVPVAEESPSVQEEVPEGRDIPVETELYSAVLTEAGGGIKSFKLKKYRETVEKDSDLMELVTVENVRELPLYFSWGTEPAKTKVPLLAAARNSINIGRNGEKSLIMRGDAGNGVEIIRTLTFNDLNYTIGLQVEVHNSTRGPVQGAPYLGFSSRPFGKQTQSRFLFNGPAALQDDDLQEIKLKDLKEGGKELTGKLRWTAYEGTYFMCAVIPQGAGKHSARFSLSGEDKVSTLLSSDAVIIPPQGSQRYNYTIYFGPKKLADLKKVGADLDRIVNFGWFDVVAKPTLYLLNFLHRYIPNYGIAIILVTIIIKLLFWPIASKGMKSMKTMQKIQPKMTKLREKYKDDKERLNAEMIKLYKTYKVNPMGGCLPMIVQIPVFFALYKVLLQTIELRHAPFMLWINDLSAPDRLYIGFQIPFTGGLPVLTLLMGASMFLQQKMTPTSADPAQAKVMMFMPVIFTFMFLNFASGLVLYWFINNLLSIAQQYFINRQIEA